MKPRPILAGAVALLILQSLPAANVAPVLSGVGKLIFPENSVSAYLQASSGALTVASGGTNQDVKLLPTGTGGVYAPTTTARGVFTSNSQALSSTSGGAFSAYTTGTASAADQRLGVLLLGMLDGSTMRNSGAVAAFSNEAWTPGTAQGTYLTLEATANGAASRTQTVYVTDTGVSIAKGAVPSYPLDVTGDVNTTGVYRKGGTQVVGARGAAVTAPSGGGTIDSQARTAINDIISRLQAHGLIN